MPASPECAAEKLQGTKPRDGRAVGRGAKDNTRMHHDALEFPDGRMVLLTG